MLRQWANFFFTKMTSLNLTGCSVEDASAAILAHCDSITSVKLPSTACVDSLLLLLCRCTFLKELEVNMTVVTYETCTRHMPALLCRLIVLRTSHATARELRFFFRPHLTIINDDTFVYTPLTPMKPASIKMKMRGFNILHVNMLMRHYNITEITLGFDYFRTTVLPYDLKMVKMVTYCEAHVVRLTKKPTRRSVFVGLRRTMDVPCEPMDVFTRQLSTGVINVLSGYEKYIDSLTVYMPVQTPYSPDVAEFLRKCTHLDKRDFHVISPWRAERSRPVRRSRTAEPVLPVPLGQSVGMADIWRDFMASTPPDADTESTPRMKRERSASPSRSQSWDSDSDDREHL